MWSLTNPAFFFFLSFTQMDMPTARTNDACAAGPPGCQSSFQTSDLSIKSNMLTTAELPRSMQTNQRKKEHYKACTVATEQKDFFLIQGLVM
jgi:hypothetical protein